MLSDIDSLNPSELRFVSARVKARGALAPIHFAASSQCCVDELPHSLLHPRFSLCWLPQLAQQSLSYLLRTSSLIPSHAH